jgi:hypothetical protein
LAICSETCRRALTTSVTDARRLVTGLPEWQRAMEAQEERYRSIARAANLGNTANAPEDDE